MNTLNIKNNPNSGFFVIWMIVGLAVILSSCRTTSSYSKNKKGRSRILEQRESVPNPYQEPSVLLHKKIEVTKPSKSIENRTSVTKVSPNAGWTGVNPSAIKGPIIEKKVFPVEIPTMDIPPVIIDEKAISSKPTYKKKAPPPKLSVVEPLTYRVAKGDTLWDIAQLYGVSVGELASKNNINKKGILAVGTVLSIPAGGTYRQPSKRLIQSKVNSKKTKRKVSKKIHKKPIPASGKYTVEKGDNLWEISQTFGISLQKLKEINGLNNSDILHPGQGIILVDSKPSPSPNQPLAKPVIDSPEINSRSISASIDREDSGEQTQVDVIIHVPDTNLKKQSANPENKALVSSTIDLKNLPHYVSSGDTLETIAEMYGSEVDWILKENPEIQTNDDLAEGMEIQVPCPDIE